MLAHRSLRFGKVRFGVTLFIRVWVADRSLWDGGCEIVRGYIGGRVSRMLLCMMVGRAGTFAGESSSELAYSL